MYHSCQDLYFMSCAVSSVLWTRGNIYEPKPNPVCFLVSPLYLEKEKFCSDLEIEITRSLISGDKVLILGDLNAN